MRETRPEFRSLVAPERHIRTGRSVDFDRADKGRHDSGPHGRVPRRRARLVVAGVAGLAVLTAAGFVFATRDSGDDPLSEAAAEPTTAVPTTITTSTTGAIQTSTTLPAVLDPARISAYEITATWTRVVGSAPADVTVGGVTNLIITCTNGRCPVGDPNWGWTILAAAPSFAFTTSFNDNQPPTPCDPLTVTFNGVRSSDGSYTGELVSDPAQLSGRAQSPDGQIVSCNYYGVTQAITMSPTVG